ncbi:MAG: class I SAM-dependent methyltransferase [Acidobacteria bacterium]|nr:class I SAM-dependent methyltransferase [Acidobacteriota bacterium]
MTPRQLIRNVLAGLFVASLATPRLLALQIGSRPAAEWIPHLEDPQRVAGLKIDEVVQIIGVKPGMVVADIGSGSGVFTRPFAKAAGPTGKAIAVDIDSALLSYVSERAAKEGVRNIETHLAVPDDAKLSGPIVDVAFFHDVLHHIEHSDVYMKNLAKYIKPDGRIVIIERAAHAGQHGLSEDDPNAAMHQAMHGNTQGTMEYHGQQVEMSSERQKVDAMLAAAGFYPAQESDLFGADKFFVIYSRKKN